MSNTTRQVIANDANVIWYKRIVVKFETAAIIRCIRLDTSANKVDDG